MKKLLFILFLLPIFCFAQTPVVPQFKRHIPADSLLGYSIPGISGNHWLPDTAWVRKYGTPLTWFDSLIFKGLGTFSNPITIDTIKKSINVFGFRQVTSNPSYFTDLVTSANATKSFEIKSNGTDVFSASSGGTALVTVGNTSTRQTQLSGSLQDTGVFISSSGYGYGLRMKQTYTPTANNDTLYGVRINNKRALNDGNIASTGSITGGSGYTNGTYTAQALSKVSGTGSGINGTATIVVSGGAITSVTIVNKGANYNSGDVLTAAVPGGTGFSFPVASTGSYSGVVYEPLNVKGLSHEVLAGDSSVVVDVNGNFKKAIYGGSVAGSSTQIQYNNSGAFGASSNLLWDNTNGRLSVGVTDPTLLFGKLQVLGQQAWVSTTGPSASVYAISPQNFSLRWSSFSSEIMTMGYTGGLRVNGGGLDPSFNGLEVDSPDSLATHKAFSINAYMPGRGIFPSMFYALGNSTIFIPNIVTGTAGTDSLMVHSSTGQIKLISPSYYGSSGSGVTSVTGTTNRTTSTGGTTPIIDISSTFEALLGKVANPLSQFASTTSSQLASVLSDETGTGVAVFNNSPTLITPALGTPSALVGTNITGTGSSFTAGNITASSNSTLTTLSVLSLPYSQVTGTPSLSGYLTAVSVASANGFTGSSSGGATPALTLALQNATTSQSGQLTSTDWNTFNGKSPAAGSSSITTVGTLVSGSIPYSLLTGTPSIPAAANPTASAGTSAVNGSATTFMRADAAPKVDSAAFTTKALLSTYLTKAQILALGYGTGTVTSITTSTGIIGGTITGSGTLKADTSVLQSVLNFFPKADTRYLKSILPWAPTTPSYNSVPPLSGDSVRVALDKNYNASLGTKFFYPGQQFYKSRYGMAANNYFASRTTGSAPIHIMFGPADSRFAYAPLAILDAVAQKGTLNSIGFVGPYTNLYNSGMTTFTQTGTYTVTRNDNTSAATQGIANQRMDMTGTSTWTVQPASRYPFDKFSVYYNKSTTAGVFTVTVDGGSPVTVTATHGSGPDSLGTYTLATGLNTQGSHTILISWVSGAPRLYGMEFQNQAEPGYIVDIIQSGASQTGTWSQNSYLAQYIAAMSPTLNVMWFDVNDAVSNVSAATYITNIKSLITGMALPSTCSTVLMGYWPKQTSAGSGIEDVTADGLMTQYVAAEKLLVTDPTYNVSFYDLRAKLPSFAQMVTAAMWSDDRHPNINQDDDITLQLVDNILPNATNPISAGTFVNFNRNSQLFAPNSVAGVGVSAQNGGGGLTEPGTGMYFKTSNTTAVPYFQSSGTEYIRMFTDGSTNTRIMTFFPTSTYATLFRSMRQGSTSTSAWDMGVNASNQFTLSTNNADIVLSPGGSNGVQITSSGGLKLVGTTSGIVSVLSQAIAGTYNFNLPITVGTAGQVLTSQGGSSTAMTWTSTVKGHTIFTPTTGGTVSLVNNQTNVINPSGSLVTLTVNLPSSPANDDRVVIKYTQAITTVTYSNGTVIDGITAPTAGGLVVLVYDSGTTSWY